MSTSRRNPPQRRAARPNPFVIGGFVIGLLILVVFAVVLTNDSDSASDDDPYAEHGVVTVIGDALAPMPKQSPDPAIGTAAPTLRSERPVGEVVIAPGTSDEPMMIVFLAHWCPHCQAELPVLVEMDRAGAFDGVRVVAVLTATTSARPNFPPTAWLDAEGFAGERFYDDSRSSAGAAYGTTSYPMIVFVDEEGIVAQRTVGRQPREVIEAAIAAITVESNAG